MFERDPGGKEVGSFITHGPFANVSTKSGKGLYSKGQPTKLVRRKLLRSGVQLLSIMDKRGKEHVEERMSLR